MRLTAYMAPSRRLMTRITLQNPPLPMLPRSTKSARNRDMVASCAAVMCASLPPTLACAGTSAGCSSSSRNALRWHGGDLAALTMPERDGARGGGIRNKPSRSAPFEFELSLARWRKSPCESGCCELPPQFCDMGWVLGGWDPSWDWSGCDGVGSYPNLGRLCRPGLKFAGDLS